MHISSTGIFDADPTTVYQMFTDRDFLTEVCIRGGAEEYEVKVNGDTTWTRRALTAPAALRKFAGNTLHITEEVRWGPPDSDGGRVGELHLTVLHQPINVDGTTVLTPQGDQTDLAIDAELVVHVPMFGRKLERVAAPQIVHAMEWQQRVGMDWLAKQ